MNAIATLKGERAAGKRRRRGGDKKPPDDGRPVIRLEGGELPGIVTAAEDALLSSGAALYQYAGMVVRAVRVRARACDGAEITVWRLLEIGRHSLVEEMTRVARFEREDRSGAWLPTDCPVTVADTYLGRQGQWRLPVLRGLIFAPTLRADGSILQTPGYDAASGLLYDPLGEDFPAVPASPSRGDATEALAELRFAIETFPFVDRASEAVALSAFLTTPIRRSLPTAPMHCFSAPVAGSGKSMVVDMAAVLATGQRAAVIAQGKTEEEMEKRLGAALLAGDGIISIDNCSTGLGGDLLCQSLTQTSVKVRILGASKAPEVPVTAAMFSTGNNLTLIGDMTRRGLLSSLDPQCEQPELRQFDVHPVNYVTENRGKLIVAALTSLRAFVVAGKPSQKPPLGSFEEWSRMVRDCLLWLNAGDPCDTLEKARADDPVLTALRGVLIQWALVFREERVTAKQVIDAATESVSSPTPPYPQVYSNSELREALIMVAGVGGAINSRRLGKFLSANQGRIVEGGRLVKDTKLHGDQLWRLEMV